MIDFRYHLISLIGVILALALGIIAGSGFIGGPILENLESDVADLRTELGESRQEVDDLRARLDQAERFAQGTDDHLTTGVFDRDPVVVFDLAGSQGGIVEAIRDELVEAGARVVTEITFSDRFALDNAPTRDELALIVGATTADPPELLNATARTFGDRAAAAAEDRGDALERVEQLADALERSEFVGIARTEGESLIPTGARFVVVGGNSDRGPFEGAGFTVSLVSELAERGAPTVVAEPQTSSWTLVESVRADVTASSVVSTVDNADSTIGRIALVLALERSAEGQVGHYGVRGNAGLIPEPESRP
ncbi:MAG: copper transporter [Actinomycetota bacterium]|nr:copper transporter [Actinomycetota bacterium]